MDREVHVLLRVQPDVRHRAGQKDMTARPQLGDTDRLAFQIADCADLLGPEQLEAADVSRSDEQNGSPRVHLNEEGAHTADSHRNLPRGQRLIHGNPPRLFDVLHGRESLASQ